MSARTQSAAERSLKAVADSLNVLYDSGVETTFMRAFNNHKALDHLSRVENALREAIRGIVPTEREIGRKRRHELISSSLELALQKYI